MKMTKILERLMQEERLKDLSLFSLEKRCLRGIMCMRINTLREGVKKMETGSLSGVQCQDKT